MRFQSAIALLAFLLCGSAFGEAMTCDRFTLQKQLYAAPTTGAEGLAFRELWEGKLFYKDGGGDCLPTNDSYLVGLLPNGMPRVLISVEGHSLSARPSKLGGKNALLVFYHTGANLQVLSSYLVESQSLRKVLGEPIVSNLGQITVNGDSVTLNNQESDAAGKKRIVEHRFLYKAGAFTSAAKSKGQK